MDSLKRPATEPLLPPRLTKHRRISEEITKPARSGEDLFARLRKIGRDVRSLCSDTFSLLVTGETPLQDESSLSPAADAETSSTSPPSSSMISTPQQTPPPAMSGKDTKATEQSTPTQTLNNSAPSSPRPLVSQIKIRSPQNATPADSSFQIFEHANFSTPKAPSSSSSLSRVSVDTPSLDRVLETNIVPNMQGLELAESTKLSQTPNARSFTSSPWTGNSSKRTKGNIQRRQKRVHIYEESYKRSVIEERRKIQQDLRQQYEISKSKGFNSSPEDFKDYLDYKFAIAPHVTSNTGLFSTKIRNDTKRSTEEFLVRALERAKSTLNERQAPQIDISGIEKIQEERRAREQALEKSLRQPSLPETLSPDEEKQVDAFLRKNGAVAKFATEQVSHQDIIRLQPRQWLNDEIINFYGAMIRVRSEGCKENPGAVPFVKDKGKARAHKTPLNVHCLSSFFWEKYTQVGYEKGRLAKWTKKVDIFSKDAVLIPVNHGNAHWTAASINFRLKRIESYDSMAMADEKVCKVLRRYLNEEHMNKKKKPFNFDGWQDWHPSTTPQQENGFDCGVFTCQFLESLSRGEDIFNFSQRNMPYLRRRMIWEIGNGKFYDG